MMLSMLTYIFLMFSDGVFACILAVRRMIDARDKTQCNSETCTPTRSSNVLYMSTSMLVPRHILNVSEIIKL
jgi:hypothetical protein